MPDKVVLDSSVIAAMFFREDASTRAIEAAAKSDLITLDLAIAEVGNVAWKQVVLCSADKDQTLVAFKKCQSFISEACELIRAEDLTMEAYNISIVTGTAFYDSLFLAAAEESQVPLLTLDRRLYERAKLTRNVQLI
ncbi:MAG: type II toxin-antitoxin system VapC family toxin [Methanothrix sp.]